jgi:transposase
MRKNLFWLSDEQWERIEPYLPTDVRAVHHINSRHCMIVGVS